MVLTLRLNNKNGYGCGDHGNVVNYSGKKIKEMKLVYIMLQIICMMIAAPMFGRNECAAIYNIRELVEVSFRSFV